MGGASPRRRRVQCDAGVLRFAEKKGEHLKNFSIWHWALLVAILGVTGLLAAGLGTAIYDKGVGSGEVASWVQAIGSILAIVAAFAVASHQFELAMKAERQREQSVNERVLLNILAIVAQAADLVIDARNFRLAESPENLLPDTPEYRQREILRLNDVLAVLSSIQLHDLGSVNAVNAIVSMRRIIGRTVREIEVLEGELSCGTDRFMDDFDHCAENAQQVLNGIEAEFIELKAHQEL